MAVTSVVMSVVPVMAVVSVVPVMVVVVIGQGIAKNASTDDPRSS